MTTTNESNQSGQPLGVASTEGLGLRNEALELAVRFHTIYEWLAPTFGYETRTDTRDFDPDSKNGRLMIAVCNEVIRHERKRAMFARRPGLWALDAREALELIAAPKRPDGTWNRDREACRQLAAEALGRYED